MTKTKSSALTRANLVENYKKAVEKVKELNGKQYNYKTARACQPFGEVKNMSINDCVMAYATIHDGVRNIENGMSFLGVTAEQLKSAVRKYLGYPVADWDADLKLRVEEINDSELKKKYETIIKKFSNNFSDDDRFAIEMGEIEDMGFDL